MNLAFENFEPNYDEYKSRVKFYNLNIDSKFY